MVSLAIQWLCLCLPLQGAVGWIPCWGAKTPHASWSEYQNIKQTQYCNKFNKDLERKGPHQKHLQKKRICSKSQRKVYIRAHSRIWAFPYYLWSNVTDSNHVREYNIRVRDTAESSSLLSSLRAPTLLYMLTSCSAILNALSCRVSLSVLELAGDWIRWISRCSHSSRRSRIFFSSEMYILATVSSLSSVNAQAQKVIKHYNRDQQTWKKQIYPETGYHWI